MALLKNIYNRPLTFDVSLSLYQDLQKLQNLRGEHSISTLIRQAIQTFNFHTFEGHKAPHKQLSVRLPENLKLKLLKFSRDKKVSMGELLRATLEALQDANRLTQNRSKPMAISKVTTKTATKAAPKKAAAKVVKTVKKIVKKVTKPTVKKAVKKTVAKKAIKKATTVKKTVAKKK